MLLHSQMLYEYHKVHPYLTFLGITFSSSKDRLWYLLKACWVFFSTEETTAEQGLWWQPGQKQREINTCWPFCHDGPRLAPTAWGSHSRLFFTDMPNAAHRTSTKRKVNAYLCSVVCSCTESIPLLVVLLSWNIHSSQKLVREQTGAGTSYARKLFGLIATSRTTNTGLTLYHKTSVLAWSSCTVWEENRIVSLWRNLYNTFYICLLYTHVELGMLITLSNDVMIWGKTCIFQ